MSEANNLISAVEKLIGMIKAIFDLVNGNYEKKIKGLKEELENANKELDSTRGKLSEKKEKIKEMKGERVEGQLEVEANKLMKKIKKIENAQDKLNKVDFESVEIKEKLIGLIIEIKHDPKAKENGWVNDGNQITKKGLQEATGRFLTDVLDRTIEPSVDDMVRNAEELAQPFICSAELENLIGTDSNVLPFLPGYNDQEAEDLFSRIPGGETNERMIDDIKNLFEAQESGRPVQFRGNFFVCNKDKNSYVKDTENHSQQQHNRT